jgi:hypothetical protein
MPRSLFLALSALALAAVAAFDRPTDTLVLSNGRRVQGHVLRERPDEYLVLVDTRQETFPKARVESVTSPVVHLDEFVRRLVATKPTDAAANVELAAWCAEKGLELEANFLRWRAIAADWDHAPAHEALGHRQRGGGWQVRIGKSWLDRKQFEKQLADWRTSPTLETSLGQVRGNVPLGYLTDTLVRWTRHYHAVYSLFGNDMGLPHTSTWASTHLHGTSRSFPSSGANEPQYYLASEFRVVVDNSRLPRNGAVERTWVQQILHMAYRNAESGRGSAPPWLTESLALYIAASLGDPLGGGLPDPARSLLAERDWFRIHANASSPDSLSRILNASYEDLNTLQGHETRLAQAYTLLDLCLHAEGGAHRAKFASFLEGTLTGATSSTHFQNAMGFDNRTFSATWQDWAKTRAEERAKVVAGEGGER